MNLPIVNQQVVDRIFNALSSMEVSLDDNPLEYGPRRLNGKVAEVRQYLSDIENVYLQVSLYIQKYKAAFRAAQGSLELGKKHLMANDPETRAGRNLATQDAIASVKLRDEVEEVSRMSSVLEDLEALMTVIKSKRADLKDIQGRIKDQINLCREEIGLGGRWGSKPPPGIIAPDLDQAPSPDHKSLRDLQKMFSTSVVVSYPEEGNRNPEGEDLFTLPSEELETSEVNTKDLLTQVDQDQSDVDDFLLALETEAPKKQKSSIEDILGGELF